MCLFNFIKILFQNSINDLSRVISDQNDLLRKNYMTIDQ